MRDIDDNTLLVTSKKVPSPLIIKASEKQLKKQLAPDDADIISGVEEKRLREVAEEALYRQRLVEESYFYGG